MLSKIVGWPFLAVGITFLVVAAGFLAFYNWFTGEDNITVKWGGRDEG